MNTPTRKSGQTRLMDGAELSASPLQSTPKSSKLDSPYTSSPEYMCSKESHEFEIIWDGNSPQRTIQKSRSKNYKSAFSRSRLTDVKNNCPFRRKRNPNDIDFFKQKFEHFLKEMNQRKNSVSTNSTESVESINFEHFFDNDDFFESNADQENENQTVCDKQKKGILTTLSEIKDPKVLDDSFDLLLGTIDDETLDNFTQVETGSQAILNNNVPLNSNKLLKEPINNLVSSVKSQSNLPTSTSTKEKSNTTTFKHNQISRTETELKSTKTKFGRSESSGNLSFQGNASKNFQCRNHSFPTTEEVNNKYALEKIEDFPSHSNLNSQDNSNIRNQCTPEEIEKKRLMALEKFKKNLISSQSIQDKKATNLNKHAHQKSVYNQNLRKANIKK